MIGRSQRRLPDLGRSIYPTHQPTPLEYVGSFVLFFVLVGLTFAVYVVWQTPVLLLLGLILGRSMALQFTDMTALVVIVFSLFALLMVAEPYLRAGLARSETRRRFARIAVPLVAIVVLGMIARVVILAAT